VPKLKLKWAFGVPDTTSMRSQPAVYAGRVFLAGPAQVYSLDAMTGCVHWSTSAAAAIRSGVVIAPARSRILVVFGDAIGRLQALDASTGEPVWQLQTDEHPEGFPGCVFGRRQQAAPRFGYLLNFFDEVRRRAPAN
jgi:polyvinyl alcohol dehydrogenase (cytochrome)